MEYLEDGEFMEEKEEAFKYDEYPTKAQDIVRDFRDQLHFNRLAAYELPSLAKFRQPYIPPKASEKPVTYRYTVYLGESHPAEKKVVLQLRVANLKLSEAEEHKFKLLAGSRYNYLNDEFKMSSDKFLEPAQNTTYLSDVLDDLIKEAKTNPEEFADVPLDKRHIIARGAKRQNKNKRNYKFPEEWKKPINKSDRGVDLNEMLKM
ncbi:unnamed protein product [Ambrosiozyma monospora]|uniref:Unnamed protein product n=1 Tax=Ambrosiozyma monospora TaxID=43982 RepID=A0A9W7DI16_AMBMO|nr:unnamed protein product [Ambrosiozyma monospora]